MKETAVIKKKRRNLLESIKILIEFMQKENPHPKIPVLKDIITQIHYKNDLYAIEKIKLLKEPSLIGSIGNSIYDAFCGKDKTDKQKWIKTRFFYNQVLLAADNLNVYIRKKDDQEIVDLKNDYDEEQDLIIEKYNTTINHIENKNIK